MRSQAMKEEERHLMERLTRGEESAWHELFVRHYPFMCYLAAQYVHDDFLASALASDVISHLWEIRTSVRIETSLRAYLLRSTRNRCLNYLQSAPELREEVFSRSVGLHPAFDEEHPLGILLEKELEQQLARVLERLPEQTRRVFSRSRFDGMTYHQIAAEMEITVHTVKYHIRQALALLRQELGGYLTLALLLSIPFR